MKRIECLKGYKWLLIICRKPGGTQNICRAWSTRKVYDNVGLKVNQLMRTNEHYNYKEIYKQGKMKELWEEEAKILERLVGWGLLDKLVRWEGMLERYIRSGII